MTLEDIYYISQIVAAVAIFGSLVLWVCRCAPRRARRATER